MIKCKSHLLPIALDPLEKLWTTFGKIAHFIAPRFFSNSVNMGVFVLISSMISVFVIGLFMSWLLGKIKSPRARAILAIVGCILFVDFALISEIKAQNHAKVGQWIAVGILDLILVGIVPFVRYLEKKHPTLLVTKDLNLKDQQSKRFGFARCPNCLRRTISRQNAIKAPQTCGECGRKFVIKRSKFKEVLIFLWSLIVGLCPIYLWEKGELPKTATYVMLMVAILGILPIIYKSQKIVEVLDR